MAHYKRHKPRRQVSCYMCQWHRAIGNSRSDWGRRSGSRGVKKDPLNLLRHVGHKVVLYEQEL